MKKVSKKLARKSGRNIYVEGVFIDVWLIDGQWVDSERNIYEYLPNGKYAKVEPKKDHFPKINTGELKKYQEITLEDGTTWRNQPNSKGKFELVLVAKPKAFTSLSPDDPSRHNKHSGSSGSK